MPLPRRWGNPTTAKYRASAADGPRTYAVALPGKVDVWRDAVDGFGGEPGTDNSPYKGIVGASFVVQDFNLVSDFGIVVPLVRTALTKNKLQTIAPAPCIYF